MTMIDPREVLKQLLPELKKKSWIDSATETIALDCANSVELYKIKYAKIPIDGGYLSITNRKNSWNLYDCLNSFSVVIGCNRKTFNIILKDEENINKYVDWIELIKDQTKTNNILKAIENEYVNQITEFKKIRKIPSFQIIKKVNSKKLPTDLRGCDSYYFCYTGDNNEEFICKTISSTVPNITLNNEESYQVVVQIRYNILTDDITTHAYLNVIEQEKDKAYPTLLKTMWYEEFDILENYMNRYIGKECINFLDTCDTSNLPEDLITELEILAINGLD